MRRALQSGDPLTQNFVFCKKKLAVAEFGK